MNSFEEIYSLVSDFCKTQMTEVAFNLWIKDIVPIKLTSEYVRLGVNSDFKQNIVSEKYKDLLSRGFERVLGFPVEIRIEVMTPEEENKPREEYIKPPAPEVLIPSGDYEYTFDTFIVGSSNKFAHAAAMAVATHDIRNYNPLFIHGDSGLGKTHLLFAIMNEVKRRRPDAIVEYVKGEEFTNELIAAIRSQTTPEFREKYRKVDYLLVDDIQFIAGRDSTQEEFFHTFNALHEAGKQIVLVSDRPPKEIKTLEDRLRSRFESGLMADIQPADFETRIAIIQRKADLLNLDMPNEVAEYIANNLKSNIRQLEGAVKNIKANSLIYENRPITIMVAQAAIRDILNDNQPVPVTISKIISEVGRTFNVSEQDIKSNKRAANISRARQVAMYVIKDITQMSMAAIGDEFGGRDHSTVVYAIAQTEKMMKTDSRLREIIEDITKNVRDM
ncbi:MAG: chromosomal replication initiator protein DnaA [Oscillospiraceae bacterium]|nr:chromosomal replication initiator protein DnaA [Oscillospiraceae bacterium]MBR3953742.1 chromosomal replication initiator protein DnaA [Oscillospiraceae bacterium]